MSSAPSIRRATACLVLACAAIALAGCDPAAGLYGQWELDSSKLQADLSQQGSVAAKLLPLMSLVQPTIEFKADGSCQATVGGLGSSSSVGGKWRLVRQEGGKLVIAVHMDDEASEREISVLIADDDHIEMPLPSQVGGLGSKTVPFVRVKPK